MRAYEDSDRQFSQSQEAGLEAVPHLDLSLHALASHHPCGNDQWLEKEPSDHERNNDANQT